MSQAASTNQPTVEERLATVEIELKKLQDTFELRVRNEITRLEWERYTQSPSLASEIARRHGERMRLLSDLRTQKSI